jgi:hypothetical protein
MTRDEIAAVVERIPLLNINGTEVYRNGGDTPAEIHARLREDREMLLRDVDGCSRAEAWLRDKPKIKTPRVGSYWLKHVAEVDVGYICNGSFVVAAIHLGFPYRMILDCPNPLIGISRRYLKEHYWNPSTGWRMRA